MDQGFKHFSHVHNLIMHEMPEGIEVSCSCCHSTAIGTVYVCWQCNFFMHDQCYRATRSLKHPSHPPHPLTLVPYPTYQSNSFYCNSCQIIGTGISYTCAECEFNLHVQCAYPIARATSFKNANLFQELVTQRWNGMQDSNIDHHVPIPFPGVQNHYVSPNSISGVQYHSMNYESSTTTDQDPSMPHNLASLSNSMSSISISMHQTGPSVSIPTNYPIPSAQETLAPQNMPSDSIPTNYPIPSAQDPLMTQNMPSDSISTNYPIPSAQDPLTPQNMPFVSIPTNYTNLGAQYPSTPQNMPSASIPTNYPIPSAQDSSMHQTMSSVSIPTNQSDPITTSRDPSVSQNGLKNEEIMHFSHPHKLSRVNLQKDEEGDKEENVEDDKEEETDQDVEVICSGCEETLVGNGYSCVEPDCNFHLHESCYQLKREIHHKSHPEHPLTLLTLAPYDNKDGEFTCKACFNDGTGFLYHCSICKLDLHVKCASLLESVNREDHEHMLKLLYSCPEKYEDCRFTCDICHDEVEKDHWAYYCESCDYGTHSGCVDREECERDVILDPQAQLQMLQFQMQMARQQAQFMASMGSSLASLA